MLKPSVCSGHQGPPPSAWGHPTEGDGGAGLGKGALLSSLSLSLGRSLSLSLVLGFARKLDNPRPSTYFVLLNSFLFVTEHMYSFILSLSRSLPPSLPPSLPFYMSFFLSCSPSLFLSLSLAPVSSLQRVRDNTESERHRETARRKLLFASLGVHQKATSRSTCCKSVHLPFSASLIYRGAAAKEVWRHGYRGLGAGLA